MVPAASGLLVPPSAEATAPISILGVPLPDPAKVLIVASSNSTYGSNSQLDASWYQAERGLANNMLLFDMGTADYLSYGTVYNWTCTAAYANGANVTSTFSGQKLFQALVNYVAAYGTQAILTSTYTPSTVNMLYTGGGTLGWPLAGLIGNFGWFNYIGASGQGGQANVNEAFHSVANNGATYPTYQNNTPIDWLSLAVPTGGGFASLPHGRLGFPAFNTTGSADTIGEASLTIGTPAQIASGQTTILKNGVVNALAQESVNHSALPHLVTSTLNYSPYCTAADNDTALTYFTGIKWNAQNLGTAINSSSFFAGTLSPKIPVFCYALGSGDDNYNAVFGPSMTVLPGAWGAAWQSGSGYYAQVFAELGASAFCGCANSGGDPFSAVTPAPSEVLYQAYAQQAQVCFANWSATQPSGCQKTNANVSTAYVDPLYRPYKTIATALAIPTPGGNLLKLGSGNLIVL